MTIWPIKTFLPILNIFPQSWKFINIYCSRSTKKDKHYMSVKVLWKSWLNFILFSNFRYTIEYYYQFIKKDQCTVCGLTKCKTEHFNFVSSSSEVSQNELKQTTLGLLITIIIMENFYGILTLWRGHRSLNQLKQVYHLASIVLNWQWQAFFNSVSSTWGKSLDFQFETFTE